MLAQCWANAKPIFGRRLPGVFDAGRAHAYRCQTRSRQTRTIHPMPGQCCVSDVDGGSTRHPSKINTRCKPSIGLLFDQRPRRWANIKTALAKRLVLPGIDSKSDHFSVNIARARTDINNIVSQRRYILPRRCMKLDQKYIS